MTRADTIVLLESNVGGSDLPSCQAAGMNGTPKGWAMAGNKALGQASRAKDDEFYTQLEDIESELKHYGDQFRGKVVFCNCDDPYESSFFKYFAMNFNHLGLKKLIATCYSGSPISGKQLSLLEIDGMPEGEPANAAYAVEIAEVSDANNDGAIGLADVEHLLKHQANAVRLLSGSGDFRSPECIALLDEADIVVTNPPFSLFREYLGQLVEHDKKFLILANHNAITYRDVFLLLRDNKMWLGHDGGQMAFRVPDYYPPRATRYWQDETGQKWRSFGNMCWFTNLDLSKRHEDLVLYRTYDEAVYPSYDTYEAIHVSKVAEIPMDFDGVMGVPITFLSKHNPDQFEIVGLLAGNIKGLAGIPSSTGKDGPYVGGKLTFGRILIRNKRLRNRSPKTTNTRRKTLA